MSVIENFRAAMRRARLDYGGPLYADGKLYRIKVEGDKARNSWYVLYDVPAVGVFGCWRLGIKESWSEKGREDYTAVELREVQMRLQQAKEKERIRHEPAQKAATWILKRTKPVQSHGYLERKGVKPYGQLLEYRGMLTLPLRDSQGRIHALQFIDVDGGKRFLTGGRVAGCFFTLADNADKALVICEGYATGASIHEATGFAVICAMNCGNLLAVARSARKLSPQREIVIAADSDQWTGGNPWLSRSSRIIPAARRILTTSTG